MKLNIKITVTFLVAFLVCQWSIKFAPPELNMMCYLLSWVSGMGFASGIFTIVASKLEGGRA